MKGDGVWMYSLLERHIDGPWWYHPGMTFNTAKQARDAFKRRFWWDLSRVHKVFKHQKPLPQAYDSYTTDFKTFYFGGIAVWKDCDKVILLASAEKRKAERNYNGSWQDNSDFE